MFGPINTGIMMDGDDSAWYMLGLGTGFLFGLVLGVPDTSSVVVPLGRDDFSALEAGALTEDLEQRVCDRLREAFAQALESEVGLEFLCAEDADAPREPE